MPVIASRSKRRAIDAQQPLVLSSPVVFDFPERLWGELPDESKHFWFSYVESEAARTFLETDYEYLVIMTLLHARIILDGLNLKSRDVAELNRMARNFASTHKDRLSMNILVRQAESGDANVARDKVEHIDVEGEELRFTKHMLTDSTVEVDGGV